MPPCAATVWQRVGNTLVMQAVLQAGLGRAHRGAQARTARADDDDVIGVVDDLVGGWPSRCGQLRLLRRLRVRGGRRRKCRTRRRQWRQGSAPRCRRTCCRRHGHSPRSAPAGRAVRARTVLTTSRIIAVAGSGCDEPLRASVAIISPAASADETASHSTRIRLPIAVKRCTQPVMRAVMRRAKPAHAADGGSVTHVVVPSAQQDARPRRRR